MFIIIFAQSTRKNMLCSKYNVVSLVMEYAEHGIVMDIAPHSIAKSYSDIECRNIFKQLVAAVHHLHENGIIHRGNNYSLLLDLYSNKEKINYFIDIKPQNLIFSSNNIVKLIDFGNATVLSEIVSYNSTGTPAFMAPELLKRGKQCRTYILLCMHSFLYINSILTFYIQ
jgi:serine/threonine protein kinase